MRRATARRLIAAAVAHCRELTVPPLSSSRTLACGRLDDSSRSKAQTLLVYNKPGVSNRYVSRTNIRLNVRALEDGYWENTGEPIIISDERLLNDGQHRLMAVIESGQPAIMDLRFGVPRRAFASTNSGSKRLAADGFRIGGHKDASNLASTSRLLISYIEGLPGGLYLRIPNAEITETFEKYEDELVRAVSSTVNMQRLVRNSQTMLLCFFAFRTASEATAQSFIDVLRTGEGRITNPPHMYREYLLRITKSAATSHRIAMLANGILAWNAYLSGGRKTLRLDWTGRGGRPFPEVADLKL